MGANLNRILVVDIESTCWETPEEQGTQPMEVIEIGICELIIKSRQIVNKQSFPVRPQFTKVSPFCEKLTGWTQAEVDKAPPIDAVLLEIQKAYAITRHHVWTSFGEYDRVKLSSDRDQEGGLFKLYSIERENYPFSFMRAHYNIKTLMALKERLDRELGMTRALTFYGEKLEGRHHNGADDAYNIAKIVRRVLS